MFRPYIITLKMYHYTYFTGKVKLSKIKSLARSGESRIWIEV